MASASSLTLASPNAQSDQTNEGRYTQSAKYTQNELTQIREIHNKVIEQGLATLNSDGTITVNTDASKLGVDEDMFREYIESLQNLNAIVQSGAASFDKTFKVTVKSRDEITKIVYQRDKKFQQGYNLGNHNKFDGPQKIINNTFTPSLSYILPLTSLPTLYAYETAQINKQALSDYYWSIEVYLPSSYAYSAAVGYWIGKVQEGGAWDYKIVSGFSPSSKQWSAICRWQTMTKTSEWFGNYNYGFTGTYLFSLNTILAGGDGVSLVFNHTSDSQDDKDSIIQGYTEYS